MKKTILILAFICTILAVHTAIAQEPVATLEHGGTSNVFYGQSSFVDAYTASVNGDQIYLSAGYFTAPTSIAKGVKITGAGHFPIEGKQTQIITGLTINKGADSLRLEGLFINGDISYDANNSINYVKVIRCRFYDAYFKSTSSSASKNYCSFEECYIGSVFFNYFGDNFLLRNSTLSGYLRNINGNALIDGNIFLLDVTGNYLVVNGIMEGGGVFNNIKYSIIRNNIILSHYYICIKYNGTGEMTGNTIDKNLIVSSYIQSPFYGTANYTGIAQANIFVNQSGYSINYSQDYHLKAPATYIGTDGKQVGIYGGLGFKENGVPSNPNIISKTIAPTTDTNGNLLINITAKAQDN